MIESVRLRESELSVKVASILTKYLEGRPIEADAPLRHRTNMYRADLFLEEGCPSLYFHGRTVIELKTILSADTLYSYYQLFLELRETCGISCFILIYSDRNEYSRDLLNRFSAFRQEGYFVFSERSFVKYTNKITPKITSVEYADDYPVFRRESDEQKILEDAHNAFISGRNSLFLGAGLGASVRMPQWEALLESLIDAQNGTPKHYSIIHSDDYDSINEAFRHSSIIVGRYIENLYKTPADFKKSIKRTIYQNNPKPVSPLFEELYKVICSKDEWDYYNVDQAITFNYDDLLESALDYYPILHGLKRDYESVFDRSGYYGNKLPVYHVHGMIPQTRDIDSTPVLGELEYHNLYKEAFHWSNVIQLYALNRTTCFFVGLSMTDPNLRRLLDISRNGVEKDKGGSEHDRQYHYAIMEQKPLDPDAPDQVKDEEHFKNQEKMMAELGIRIIWYKHSQHDKIADILRYIRTGSGLKDKMP